MRSSFVTATLLACVLLTTGARGGHSIPINRRFDVLKKSRGRDSLRKLFRQAGRKLGTWQVHLAGVAFDGRTLCDLADRQPGEFFVRVVREGLRRPVDVRDFLFFIDDLLKADRAGLRGRPVWVGATRARKAGILVHPDEVFGRRPRPVRYAARRRRLHIARPRGTGWMPSALDRSPPGPRWIKRYPNPSGRQAKMAALEETNPGTFAPRISLLIEQLEEQGADVVVWSTVRDPRRGYLMWGAFMLSQSQSEQEVLSGVRKLNRLNRRWRLHVPIRWMHPRGWWATVKAARRMANAYDVVYATMDGARRSRHYRGEAVDLTAVGLPRELTLEAPDGARKTFDLSAPHQTRDLSLTIELIEWIELHFQMKKLKLDHPHWSDDEIPLAPIQPPKEQMHTIALRGRAPARRPSF